jgi:hypothetical protein
MRRHTFNQPDAESSEVGRRRMGRGSTNSVRLLPFRGFHSKKSVMFLRVEYFALYSELSNAEFLKDFRKLKGRNKGKQERRMEGKERRIERERESAW